MREFLFANEVKQYQGIAYDVQLLLKEYKDSHGIFPTYEIVHQTFGFSSRGFSRRLKKAGVTFTELKCNIKRVYIIDEISSRKFRNMDKLACDCGFGDRTGLLSFTKREFGLTLKELRTILKDKNVDTRFDYTHSEVSDVRLEVLAALQKLEEVRKTVAFMEMSKSFNVTLTKCILDLKSLVEPIIVHGEVKGDSNRMLH